ncbi:MAG: septation protein SpoVG family protein [Aquificaceae bacterium]|nr:SpoVG family protein [Aquificaceae bacterium]MCS7278247.1 SpoVG family protein [Aquificaceae bacterium]MDW8422712.1 septation protein SpoVG family protein [Aquificaceae bacterium]
MKVELVDFYPFEVSTRKPRLLAYADVKIDNKILIRGIKLYEAKHGGYFISMPEFNPETKRAIVEIDDKELLEKIRRVVVDHYKDLNL